MNILRIDASALSAGSHSRELTDRVIAGFSGALRVTVRDLALGVPHVSEAWVVANDTPDEARTAAQREVLSLSDALIDEVMAADLIVIGLPVYNFGVPACLKAWIDQVCRARRTFMFTADGPIGLLHRKRAILVYVSSGTAMGSPNDFASGYMRQVLGFIGITDVSFVSAPMHLFDPGALAAAAALADRIGANGRAAEPLPA